MLCIDSAFQLHNIVCQGHVFREINICFCACGVKDEIFELRHQCGPWAGSRENFSECMIYKKMSMLQLHTINDERYRLLGIVKLAHTVYKMLFQKKHDRKHIDSSSLNAFASSTRHSHCRRWCVTAPQKRQEDSDRCTKFKSYGRVPHTNIMSLMRRPMYETIQFDERECPIFNGIPNALCICTHSTFNLEKCNICMKNCNNFQRTEELMTHQECPCHMCQGLPAQVFSLHQ